MLPAAVAWGPRLVQLGKRRQQSWGFLCTPTSVSLRDSIALHQVFVSRSELLCKL